MTTALYAAFSALTGGLALLVLPFIAPRLQDAAEFCSSEPEVPPVPDAATWALALVHNPEAQWEVSQYISAAFRAWLWEQNCECIRPVTTPGIVCREWFVGSLTPSYQRMHRADLTEMDHIVGTPPSSGSFYVETADSVDMAFMVYPDATFASQLLELQTGIGGHATSTQSLNPGYAYYGLQARSIGGLTLGPAKIRFCYTGTGASDPSYVAPPLETPPEIPDYPTVSLCDSFEDVCATINELRLEIEALFRALPAPERARSELGWKYGTVHTGLTGHGSFDAVGILGVLVESAIPSVWGVSTSVPARAIPNVGGIHFGVGGEPEDRRQVRYGSQMILEPPALVDSVFWNFAPGITATITEVVPVPAG